MPKKQLIAVFAGLSAFFAVAGLVLVFDLTVAVSLTAAFLAVAAPYVVVRRRVVYSPSLSAPFSVWGLKFSLTILFLAMSARVLSETGFLSAPIFVAGVVLAVITNIAVDMRTAMREV